MFFVLCFYKTINKERHKKFEKQKGEKARTASQEALVLTCLTHRGVNVASTSTMSFDCKLNAALRMNRHCEYPQA